MGTLATSGCAFRFQGGCLDLQQIRRRHHAHRQSDSGSASTTLRGRLQWGRPRRRRIFRLRGPRGAQRTPQHQAQIPQRQKPEPIRELLGVVLGVQDRTAKVFSRPDRRTNSSSSSKRPCHITSSRRQRQSNSRGRSASTRQRHSADSDERRYAHLQGHVSEGAPSLWTYGLRYRRSCSCSGLPHHAGYAQCSERNPEQ